MNRGFVGVLFSALVVLAIAGGIAWWALNQNPSATGVTVPPAQTQGIPVVFYYSATKTEFPLGLFKIVGDTEGLGANYIRVRGVAKAVYALLGADAGTPLADSCQWVVNASIEIANAKRDVETYAYMSPAPALVAADLVRVVSHDQPRQVCTGQ